MVSMGATVFAREAQMIARRLLPSVLGGLLLAFFCQSATAQGAPPVLRGTVTSDREGAMEGVLVSARRQGSAITVTVVSDAKGEYAFPAGRLEPGAYQLAIRASGYGLDGAGTIEIAAGSPATADLRLKPVPVTSDQLTNSEWLTSAPGPDELKRGLLNCTDCHSAQRIFESKHTRDEFLQVFDRMGGYYSGASDLQPQRLVGDHRRPPVNPAMAQSFADYLAALNLSAKPVHGFDLKTNPRPTGRATPSSSPNTRWRERKSSPTTSSSTPTAACGSRTSASSCCPSSIPTPAG